MEHLPNGNFMQMKEREETANEKGRETIRKPNRSCWKNQQPVSIQTKCVWIIHLYYNVFILSFQSLKIATKRWKLLFCSGVYKLWPWAGFRLLWTEEMYSYPPSIDNGKKEGIQCGVARNCLRGCMIIIKYKRAGLMCYESKWVS